MHPVVRHQHNPIIAPKDMPVECSAVFNAAAVRFQGQYLLLLRVEDFARNVTFHVATSDDGIRFDINPRQIDYPLREIEKKYGAYRFDMRITPLDNMFYVCHAVWATGLGCMVGMASTTDFVHFKPSSHLSLPHNRNAVLFPEKIKGLYARLERPQDTDNGRIWVTYSPDLRFWGEAAPLDIPTTVWNWKKTGAGAMPIKTPEGWLVIYHATAKTASSENYYLGVMLLDLENPGKVLCASRKFILQPQEIYECVGQVPNVVFTCGAVETANGGLNIYYAGADTCVCLAQTTIHDLIAYCKNGEI